MNRFLLQEAIKLNKKRKRKRNWQKVVSGMVALVVFGTTYALILPAITLQTDVLCGIKEHEHTDTCHALCFACTDGLTNSQVIHSHTQLCYDAAGALACPLSEVFVHVHDDACYELTGEDLSDLQEVEAFVQSDTCHDIPAESVRGLPPQDLHIHEDSCYGEAQFCCQAEQISGHVHTDQCYEVQTVLNCGMSECEPHIHGDGCYQTVPVDGYICSVQENAEHPHDDTCIALQTTLMCTLQVSEGHTHGESCNIEKKVLVCTEEELPPHIHDDSCYHRLLTCTLEESSEYIHTIECNRNPTSMLEDFQSAQPDEDTAAPSLALVCEIPEISLHNHTEECYNTDGSIACGLEEYIEHIHNEDCLEPVLICTLPVHTHDETCFPASEATGAYFVCGFGSHIHDEGCYDEAEILNCSVPEHTHTASCVIENYDPHADVESAAHWETTFSNVSLTGNWPEDVLAIAQSQLGYTESTRNVVLQDDGSLKGYSRYGEWYGTPYGDWCTMYISFCMYYAGVKNIPFELECQNWLETLQDHGIYRTAGEYAPKRGDIIFFDLDSDGCSDHVGLVVQRVEENSANNIVRVNTIEGDCADKVEYCTYYAGDPVILGYGVMPQGDGVQLTSHGPDYTVCVAFDSDAMIPADAELVVLEIEQGSEEYEAYYLQAAQTLQNAYESEIVPVNEGDEAYYLQAAQPVQSTNEAKIMQKISFARFFDISFAVNGQMIEPSAPVRISIKYTEAIPIDSGDSGVAVHFADDGIEILDAETNQGESDVENTTDAFVFTQDSFSVTGTIIIDSQIAEAANALALSSAANLFDSVSTVKVLNAAGSETKFFADGDGFTIVLEGTIQSYQFSDEQAKTFYLTLSDALSLSSYTCSDGISSARIDGNNNTFLMDVTPVPDGYGYKAVPFRVELSGQAVNQTDNVVYVSVRWDQYLIYGTKQQFTHTSEDGTQTTVEIMGSSYTPEQYQLVVEQINAADYTSTIRNFVTQNFARRALVETAMYHVYLQNIADPNQKVPIPSPYSLSMDFDDNPVEMVSRGQAAVINMNNGTANKPAGSSVMYDGSNVSGVTISDQYSSLSDFAIVSLSGITEGTTGSGYSLQYNGQEDAFIKDPAYADYYNDNSPIGTAGSFHIVAFDTANLDAHTNGNILANNLYASSNFGTNNYDRELSYIQNYLKVNSNSASKEEHILVIGSSNELGLYDNNNKYTINGKSIDRPKNIIQDTNTESAPFINLDRVRDEIQQLAANLVGYSDANLDITMTSQKNVINLTHPDAVGILNVDPTDSSVFGKDYIQLGGFETGHEGSIIINVDCTGVNQIELPKALVVVDGQEQGTNEVTEFSNGKVLWNFVNAEGVTINTHLMTGMVIAPGATVNIMQNLNGTVVADIVNVKAESHRTDFTGKIIPQDEGEDHIVIIQKIRSGYVGTTLPNARFALFIWNGSAWERVNMEPIVTDSNGLFQMDGLTVNTAYKLVETAAPAGYVLMEEPYYFWIQGSANTSVPTVRPNEFSGHAVTPGSVLNIPNEPDEQAETTTIELRKVWDSEQPVNVNRVEFNLYQIVWKDGQQIQRTLYKTVMLTKVLNWEYFVSDLPANGIDADGDEVIYTYAVEETPVPGFTVQYSIDNTVGVSEGTITVTNHPEPEGPYMLPETGGKGHQWYTMLGALIILGALGWCYGQRRKCERRDC